MLRESKAITGKRRRKRLPIAPDVASPEVFRPTASDWERIQNAFGAKLKRDHRSAIIDVVNNYYFVHELERSAPFVIDAILWVRSLRKTLGSALNIIRRKPDDVHLEAEDFARDEVVRFFRIRRGGVKWTWGNLVGFVADLERSCESVLGELEQANGGFVEGSAWQLLIAQLTDFANVNGFPFAASKRGKTSPFVSFIRELQSTFPRTYRHHLHSDLALAEAISKARRRTGKTKRGSKPQ